VSIHFYFQICRNSNNANISSRVMFLNTDDVPAQETTRGNRVQNDTEAELVRQIVEALRASEVPESSIGVISVYRSQLRIISQSLGVRHGLEILTADRAQGRDKDCVIISLVRANNKAQVGDLLKDWRRLNVSFTRAKRKLIIIGSRKTLEAARVLNEFLKLIDSSGWIYDLPEDCTTLYNVPPSVPLSQVSPQRLSPVKSQPTVNMAGRRLFDNRPVLRDVLNNVTGDSS
jgi:DNA replication ATP-dependent helicase Dna2